MITTTEIVMKLVSFLCVFLSASLTDALLLNPSSGRNHHGLLKARSVPVLSLMSSSSSSSSSTALFFKNSTKADYDIEKTPTPIESPTTTTDSSKETKNNDLDLNSDSNLGFDDNCFPGRDENDRFRCDPSVAFWRNFQNTPDKRQFSVQDNIREIARIARRFASAQQQTDSSSYLSRHILRTSYFAMNAVLGNAAFEFADRNNNGKDKDNNNDNGNRKLFAQKSPIGSTITGAIASRMVLETMLCYEQDYFEWIVRGVYKEPWDMASLRNHRQSNPFNAMTQTSRFVREAVGTLGRRSRGTERDKQVRFFESNNNQRTASTAKPSHTEKIYPKYYQTAFHYQGDGWMSTDSANVYETSTETLFLGRQDSMQRTSLPPLVALAEKLESNRSSSSISRPMRVLEVACGTGRFMTFVRDNLPLDAEYTAVDLSPFFLEKASDNDSYWTRTRARTKDDSTTIAPSTLVQAQAEDLPFEDNSFDAVVCVYLFHEIPRHVRAKAAAEMARVVSPGGTVVLTDSVQKGERPPLDQNLSNFEKMNEPFYIDYINDDLGSHFEAAGLIPETKIVRSTTKSLSFSKPGELFL